MCLLVLAQLVLGYMNTFGSRMTYCLYRWSIVLFSLIDIVLMVVAVRRKKEWLMAVSIVAFVQVAPPLIDIVGAAVVRLLEVFT